jgi:CreA protein
MKYALSAAAFGLFEVFAPGAKADDIACISTTFRLIGAND